VTSKAHDGAASVISMHSGHYTFMLNNCDYDDLYSTIESKLLLECFLFCLLSAQIPMLQVT